jgi:anti-sigma B factor antagonist
MSEFLIETQSLNEEIELIVVRGYLDAHTFEKLDTCMGELFDAGKFRLIVDLSGVDYISSAGAGVFIGNIGKAQDQSGNIVLLNPSTNVQEVFELLGLTQIFTIVPTREEALQVFKS